MILYFVHSEHVVRLRQLSIRVAFNTVRYSSSPLPLVSVHTPLTSVLKDGSRYHIASETFILETLPEIFSVLFTANVLE
jgi:hypothetical protein